MKILVIGGTRFFGVHTVNALLRDGHAVTVATRGKTPLSFGGAVSHVVVERTDPDSMKRAFAGRHYDVVIDKLGYSSNEVKYALDAIDYDRYIHMSSTAVYRPKHWDTKEGAFDPTDAPVLWGDRSAFSYAEGKRQAERALWQMASDKNFVSVRYPFVVGETDYTGRLLFYVAHVVKQIPMYVDNLDRQMGFIHERDAGEFMAHLVTADCTGGINGCSRGTVSLRQIIEYTEKKTGIQAILCEDGDPAPYNGEVEYSINTERAESVGYVFPCVEDWIWDLVDRYIEDVKGESHASESVR